MQFTQKSKEHIDSCRFCWMCHHVCPIGNATGLERNTARARAMGLSLVERGAVEYSDDIIKNVYECSLCGACMTDCVTGWDPVMFTKEARLGAALDGRLPDYVMNMVKNVMEKGNVYGEEKNKNIPSFKDGETLFFLGEDARYKDCVKHAVELLQKANVKFAILEDEPNSGYSMDFLIGESKETKDVMVKCANVLNNYKKVICYDPGDAKVMKREYKEWGIELKCDIISFPSFISALIKDNKLDVKKSDITFTPQDSPIYARDLEETQPIRDILSSVGNVNEMLLCKEHTQLAGNLIMNEYMPDVIKAVAKNRWINALNMNTKILVTESVADYVCLKETKPNDVELLKIEEAVLRCL